MQSLCVYFVSYQVAPRQEDSDNEDDVDEDEDDEDDEGGETPKKNNKDKTEEERRKEEYGAEDDIEYVYVRFIFIFLVLRLKFKKYAIDLILIFFCEYLATPLKRFNYHLKKVVRYSSFRQISLFVSNRVLINRNKIHHELYHKVS